MTDSMPEASQKAPPPASTSDPEPRTVREVEYKGAPLDSERGPGLGCFWIQIVVLLVLLALTPLSVAWGWPSFVSGALLITVLILLLLAGQTVIFLLRLVAADRRVAGRRRPLASGSLTVGELEDANGDGSARERGPDPDGERVGGEPPEGESAGPPDGVRE